ncbi:MAG: hypothetical protein LBE62_07810 [Azonexus sp.]|jgi:hypothetical protein|nr:hypothetical protein [Azonexus sp.]
MTTAAPLTAHRLRDLLAALLALVTGAFLAWHHPLGPGAALLLFAAVAALIFLRPAWSLLIVPALLPVIDLAPWTGWLSFAESDLLILAAAGGGYLRAVTDGPVKEQPTRMSRLLAGLALLFALSLMISLGRGFADAGGFHFGWYQGYDGPMNSIRIGKSFFLALLWLPLLHRQFADPACQADRRLAWGLALGLGSAALAALWERLAFADLLNFSSDYRSTALFWEMHVGGAALDGWLLLTAPFAVYALRHARTASGHVLAAGLLILAAYAALTTFSRGVYLALLIALPLLAWQTRRPVARPGKQPEQAAWPLLRWALALPLLAVMAGLVFAGGGYRGLLAWLGVLAVTLLMPQALRGIAKRQLAAGIALGLIGGGGLALLAGFLPKGPYGLYIVLFAAAFFLLWRRPAVLADSRRIFAVAVWFALGLAAAAVAAYWGGGDALSGMLIALTLTLALGLAALFTVRPAWPQGIRWQASFLSAALAVSAAVAVFAGGGYMGGRFSTSSHDLAGRFDHWQLSAALLQKPLDLWFGKGLGRYPANYFFAAPDSKFPGAYQLLRDGENAWLSLAAPWHPMSFGDIFRVSQRLPFDANGPFVVALRIRPKTDVRLHVEVCEKHLLYVAGCVTGRAGVKAGSNWQNLTIPLAGPLLGGGPWYAPRFRMFSLGVSNVSGIADIDDIILSGPGGELLLNNGDFSDDMRRWFFSSDHDHLPWHAKNIFINVLFDQGVLGLAAFLLLVITTLWRLNLGQTRRHELAPYLSAAIVGFLAVGMFDSVIDAPRLAWLFYTLIFLAFILGAAVKSYGKSARGM